MSNDSLDDEQGSANRPPADFAGLRVAAFESRQAGEIARMITSCGGQPRVSPSLREVALDDHRSAIDFANLLITGQVDCVIFLTGVGFRQLLAVVERHVDRQRYLDALSDVVTVARGPKPVVAMREAPRTSHSAPPIINNRPRTRKMATERVMRRCRGMRFGRKDGSEFDAADFVRVRFVRSGFVQTQAEFPPGFDPKPGRAGRSGAKRPLRAIFQG